MSIFSIDKFFSGDIINKGLSYEEIQVMNEEALKKHVDKLIGKKVSVGKLDEAGGSQQKEENSIYY